VSQKLDEQSKLRDKAARAPGESHASAAEPVRSRKPFYIALVTIVILLGGLAVFQLLVKPAMIKSFLSKAVPPPATVSAAKAETASWIGRIPSVGTLTPVTGIDVAFQVVGVVSRISFESGQEVAAGAELVRLDDSVEQADLASNEAALRQAELDLARQNDLARRAYASEATQQAAQAKRDSAAAAVLRVKSLIAQKLLKAPFAGRLGIRKVEVGQYVSAGMSLVTLQALDPIRVDFPVPEQELARLKIGQSVETTVDAFAGKVFKGEIQSLDARVSQDTRTLLVRALLHNPERQLLPGMYANVSVLLGDPKNVVTVPRTAVSYSLYGDSVYVVKPAAGTSSQTPGNPPPPASGGTAAAPPALVVERRFVRAGDARDDRVEIREGLNAGDLVVTSGQLKLQNGNRVLIDNSTPLNPPSDRPRL